MNSVDFCAIYQPPAVNSLVVTQSQESGGMMKKKRDWEEEEKKTEGRQKARQRWYQPALLPARTPVSIAQASVLDNGVRYIPPCSRGAATAHGQWCGGALRRRHLPECGMDLHNPQSRYATTTHGSSSTGSSTSISTELFILPDFWKVSRRGGGGGGSGVVVVMAWCGGATLDCEHRVTWFSHPTTTAATASFNFLQLDRVLAY